MKLSDHTCPYLDIENELTIKNFILNLFINFYFNLIIYIYTYTNVYIIT